MAELPVAPQRWQQAVAEIRERLPQITDLRAAVVLVRDAEELVSQAREAGLSYPMRAEIRVTEIRCERRLGQLLIEAKQQRNRALAAARTAFRPSKKEPCGVCGRYQSLAQAHHIYPLSEQVDNGVDEIDHAYVWLCPTHHAVVHRMRAALSGEDEHRSAAIIHVLDRDCEDQEFRAVFDIARGVT